MDQQDQENLSRSFYILPEGKGREAYRQARRLGNLPHHTLLLVSCVIPSSKCPFFKEGIGITCYLIMCVRMWMCGCRSTWEEVRG